MTCEKTSRPTRSKVRKVARLGTAHGRPGDLVDFFDRVTVFEHRLDGEQRAEGADAIGDEVRTVLRRHHAFAQSLIEKAKQEARDFRLGPFGANHFDQMQVTRRVEKVDAEKVCAEIVRAAFGQLANRNAAGV